MLDESKLKHVLSIVQYSSTREERLRLKRLYSDFYGHRVGIFKHNSQDTNKNQFSIDAAVALLSDLGTEVDS